MHNSQLQMWQSKGRGKGALLCLTVAVCLAVAAVVSSWFDINLQRFVRETSLPGDVERFVKLMEIFAHGTGFLIAVLLIWTLSPEYRRRIPRLVMAYAATGLTVNLVKVIVWRPRPLAAEMALADESVLNLAHVSQSFPSGHAAAAISLAIGLSILFPRGRYVFFGLAFLACLQRVIFMAHWPSDVFAGLALGVGITGGVYFLPVANAVFSRVEIRADDDRIASHRRAA